MQDDDAIRIHRGKTANIYCLNAIIIMSSHLQRELTTTPSAYYQSFRSDLENIIAEIQLHLNTDNHGDVITL